MAGASPGINIVVPMGGIGERFARVGYRFPKPLVNLVGRPMIFWLLDNLDLTPDDRVYSAQPALRRAARTCPDALAAQSL